MKKNKVLFILAIMLSFFTLSLLANQEETEESAVGKYATWTKVIAAGAMVLATCVCAWCQARAAIAAFEGISRNPASAGAIRGLFIIGIVLIESLALYTMVVIFIKV